MTLDERIAYEGTRVMARNHMTSALAYLTRGLETKDREALEFALEQQAMAGECVARLLSMMPDEVVEE